MRWEGREETDRERGEKEGGIDNTTLEKVDNVFKMPVPNNRDSYLQLLDCTWGICILPLKQILVSKIEHNFNIQIHFGY